MSQSPLEVEVPRAYSPLLQPKRYKGARGGRGSGKSHFFAEQLVSRCFSRTTRAVCIREVQSTLKDSVKQLLEDKIKKLGLGSFFNIVESEIRCRRNGSVIIFRGMQSYNAESIKSLESFDVAWIEESQTLSKRSLRLLRPTIRKPGAEMWFSWNPRFPEDAVEEFFNRRNGRENTTCVSANWSDNPWFPPELKKERDEDFLDDPQIAEHVWEGGYEIITDGAVFAKEIAMVAKAGRIGHVPYEPLKPVHTFWDLGLHDMTSIWFAQMVGPEYRIIDFDEARGRRTPDDLRMLQSKPYVYGTDWLPHDGKAQHKTGRSIEQQMREAGRNVRIVPIAPISDQISAARTILDNCWFDEVKCAAGLTALRRYKFQVDEATGRWSRIPVHDDSSHAASAFQCLAMGLREPSRGPALKPKLHYADAGTQSHGWMR